jgi:hypothetical protein
MSASFSSRVVSHTAEFTLQTGIDTAFPLFSPEGEKRWAPGWDFTNILGAEELAPGYVFLTDSHDHKASPAIWIVSHHDPETHCVSYYKIEPEQKVGRVEVRCIRLGPTATRVRVSYTYTGLSDSGNRFVAGFTRPAYTAFIDEWRRLLTDYLATQESRPAC